MARTTKALKIIKHKQIIIVKIIFQIPHVRATNVRMKNFGDDLGLSGPVVAAFESYWPAKSQVVTSV